MANNISVKNSAGVDTTVKTTDNAGVHTPHHNVDASALPTGAATETSSAAILATAGATTGAAVVTDANGTLQQYLRGIVKLLITSGTIVLGAGTAAIGKLAANAGVIIGATEPAAATSGGATPFYNLDVDESEDAIKTSAGQLYDLTLINTTAAILYVKLYNATVANVTVGTTTPVRTIPVPGNNDTDGAGIQLTFPVGLAFDTAITIAATTGFADNDTGAPAANAIIASGSYK